MEKHRTPKKEREKEQFKYIRMPSYGKAKWRKKNFAIYWGCSDGTNFYLTPLLTFFFVKQSHRSNLVHFHRLFWAIVYSFIFQSYFSFIVISFEEIHQTAVDGNKINKLVYFPFGWIGFGSIPRSTLNHSIINAKPKDELNQTRARLKSTAQMLRARFWLHQFSKFQFPFSVFSSPIQIKCNVEIA